MTAKEVFEGLVAAAREVYDEREARAVANFLLERKFGTSRLNMATELPVEGLDGVLEDVRRGRPAQYIAGEAWFCDGWLRVREGVLVPRPETEELVRWLLSSEPQGTILDAGTGSGAIAVALKNRGLDVVGADISDDALAIARENGPDIEFVKCDILKDLDKLLKSFNNKITTIVSNPPYIPASEREQMHRNVTDFEPAEALFVPDDDPLIFYRELASYGIERLFFEIHERFAWEIAVMLSGKNYRVEVRKDINGRPRMVCATLKK